jgi:hypothetical protein
MGARRRLAFPSALALVISAVLSPTASAGQAAAIDPVAAESSLADFEQSAQAAGALGEYIGADGSLVVVLPAALGTSFAMPSERGLLRPVKTATVAVDPARLQAASDSLGALTSDSDITAAFWFDPSIAKIRLHTSQSRDEVQAALGDLMDLVDYHPAGIVAMSRFADSPPFWGGSAGKGAGSINVYDCTTGFVVWSGGTNKLVTAGHCWPNGKQVLSPYNGNVLGNVGSRHCSGNDYEWIAGGSSYAGEIYIGNVTGTGSHVKGAGNPTVGGSYYWSGAHTYENSTTVTALGITVNEGSGECGLVTDAFVFSNSGFCAAMPGDSGAPFYLKSGTDSYIRGIVIAKATDN